MSSGNELYELSPFTDLTLVDDEELHDLDFKKAEAEMVKSEANYPSFVQKGDIGVLLIHGFTGSPMEMQDLADYLTAEGFSVYNVRMAGHGSSYESLNHTTYQDWYESARYGYFVLKRNCRKVFVAGLSMGGLNAAAVAWQNDVDGAVLMAPCIKIKNPAAVLSTYLKDIVRTLPKVAGNDWKEEREGMYYSRWPVAGIAQLYNYTRYMSRHAGEFDFPVLGYQAAGDLVVSAKASKEFFEKIPSTDKTYVEFPVKKINNHVLVGDASVFREEMFEGIADWIRERGEQR